MTVTAAAVATVLLHLLLAAAQQHLARDSALNVAAVLYYASAAGLVTCYAVLLRSVGEVLSRKRWVLVVGIPLLVQTGWLFSRPVLSIDAYSYLVDAAHVHAGVSPYRYAVGEAAGTEFGEKLAAYGWRPKGISPYGPVWMNLLRIVGPFAHDVPTGVRALKIIAMCATALTAWLVFCTAPPTVRVRAFVAFWWNPVLIVEGAGEGHNDAVMALAVVLSIWCLQRRAVAAAAAALTAAVLTKWTPALFAPAYVAYAWRSGLATWRNTWIAAAAVVTLTVVAYSPPLWIGVDTFAGIRAVAAPRLVASGTGVFRNILADHPTAYTLVRLCAALATIVAIVQATRASGTLRDLIRASATIAVTFMLVTSPLYWPWYVVTPIALLALADDRALIMVLTVTSRAVAPLDLLRVRGAFTLTTQLWLTTIVALWLPSAWLVWRAIGDRPGFDVVRTVRGADL